ncbi:MAG: glycosyltransferase, partial [Acidimicrobiales bacterium]
MDRPPATLVVLAWNAWEETRTCLEALRPTLGLRDQVVVVDNGSTDGTAGGLRHLGWPEVVTNQQNRGFAAGCNQGVAAARHELVVLLNNDTIPCGRWLDSLLAAFADPSVGAAGPRSNSVSGAQLVPGASYSLERPSELHGFARRWAEDHRGRLEPVGRLVGFCLALRAGVFRSLGGFDETFEVGGYEDNDLCLRMRQAGWSLVIAHESYVHHQGHATFDRNGVDWRAQQAANRARFVEKHGPEHATAGEEPLVSACLIARDEEGCIAECLASLEGLADEVVVYDTGSSDRTAEVAAGAGAKVVRGRWEKDFSSARNAALAHCRGTWILWVDADEVLRGDLEAVRTLLHADRATEGFSVRIENLVGAGTGSTAAHRAARLFRRDAGCWRGRIHEQVWSTRGGRRLELAALVPQLWIEHRGYLDEVMRSRDKVRRNLDLARAAVDDPGVERAYALMNLGRSLYLAGEHRESLERATESLSAGPDPLTRHLAARSAIDSLVALGRAEEALAWVQRLRRESPGPAVDVLEGNVRLTMEDFSGALACYDRIEDGAAADEEMLRKLALDQGAKRLAPQRAVCLSQLGRAGEAAEVLLAALRGDGFLDTHLGTLVEALWAAERGLEEIPGAVPERGRTALVAQAVQLRPPVADAVLEACWQAWGDLQSLAAASTVAPRLALDRCLEWSARLRDRNLAASCPLVALAGDPAAPAVASASVDSPVEDQAAVDAVDGDGGLSGEAEENGHVSGPVAEEPVAEE